CVGTDDSARADHPGALPARAVRSGVYETHRPCAALLCGGLAGISDREADRAGVLLDKRHKDTGDCSLDVAGLEHCAEHCFSAIFLQTRPERRAGSSDGSGVLFRFLRTVHYFPVAVWSVGDDGDFALFRKDFALRRDYGDRLLARWKVHGIYDPLEVHRTTAGIYRIDRWGDAVVFRAGMGLPVPRN